MTTATSTAQLSVRGEGSPEAQRLFVHYSPRAEADVLDELLQGLKSEPKTIAPKFFYDARGAKLFDRITRLPEYYPTRVERDIYRRFKDEIAEAVGEERVLIEPGSGNSEKVELLLESILPRAYVPLEITESHLLNASRGLIEKYPWLEVHAVCADYSGGLDLPPTLPDQPRLVFFPGSTIGNFEPGDARQFLSYLHTACGEGGELLIGVDMVKEIDILEAAYNDSDSVTALFNLNILHHINRLTGADFDTDNFRHLAFFNRRESRIEMHLESCAAHSISLRNHHFSLAEGERIHTENSYKYSIEGFHQLAGEAGFRPLRTWCDDNRWFSVHLLEAA